ncbi:MAG: hypothetical protein A2179_06265 [Elusimicrobia bacterium GWC2_63_65]|nr:MAG: hypothetical protein A2179_06265 [Elusimicrobia bacterium GWC2_63_65]
MAGLAHVVGVGRFQLAQVHARAFHADLEGLVLPGQQLAGAEADLDRAAEDVGGALVALHAFILGLGMMRRLAGGAGLRRLGRRRGIGHVVAFLHVFHALQPHHARLLRSGGWAEVEVAAVARIPYVVRRGARVPVEVGPVPDAGVVVIHWMARGRRRHHGDRLLYGFLHVNALVEVYFGGAGGTGQAEADKGGNKPVIH